MTIAIILGECTALWGKPNEPTIAIQYHVLQYTDS